MVRLMAETAARIGEVLAMRVEDVEIADGRVIIRRGKGGAGRTVPIGWHTARSIDQYKRVRARHPFGELPNLWISRVGAFKYFGAYGMLQRRAAMAVGCQKSGLGR